MVKISTNIKNFIETITKGLSYTKTEMDTKLNGKANSSHNHSISNITNLQLTLENKSPTGHTHDDRYYTETEMNTKLNGKANSSHNHSISNITNLQSALDSKAGTSIATTSVNGLMSSLDKTKLDGIATGATKVTVDTSLSSSSTNPVQNKVVNNALNGKANSSHNHSISNITNLQSTLDSKSNTGHDHTSDEIHYAYDQNVSVTTILENKAAKHHTHDDRYYTETEMDTKLDMKMNNNYSVSTIESNFFAHKIGNIVIVTWWGGKLPTTQNSWVDWKTLPYKSCNTQPIWVNGDGHGCEVRVRVPSNSNKLQVFIDGGTGGIRPGMIVYPTK